MASALFRSESGEDCDTQNVYNVVSSSGKLLQPPTETYQYWQVKVLCGSHRNTIHFHSAKNVREGIRILLWKVKRLQNLFLQQETETDTAKAVIQCSEGDQYTQHLHHLNTQHSCMFCTRGAWTLYAFQFFHLGLWRNNKTTAISYHNIFFAKLMNLNCFFFGPNRS